MREFDSPIFRHMKHELGEILDIPTYLTVTEDFSTIHDAYLEGCDTLKIKLSFDVPEVDGEVVGYAEKHVWRGSDLVTQDFYLLHIENKNPPASKLIAPQTSGYFWINAS